MPIAMVSGAKRRKLEEGEEDAERLDHISRLPDGVLGDIVSLLPTSDGARTQVLSSRWRHVWRSAPLNIDLELEPNRTALLGSKRVTASLISLILSAHQGPGRRFSVAWPWGLPYPASGSGLDACLRCPALNGLQELEFDIRCVLEAMPPLPASVHRFSSTLRVATFRGCVFPDGNSASELHFPVLEQLSLSYVKCSETSMHALLAACPLLQSLLLEGATGCPRVQIACPTLRSIGVRGGVGPFSLQQLTIVDAPCLERLLIYDQCATKLTISVITAPKLQVLGPLFVHGPRLELGTIVIEGSGCASLKTVVHSVKVLALIQDHLSLDAVIEFIKRFPCLETLYVKTRMRGGENLRCYKYKNLISTLDIRLKKIVLTNYRGNTSHVNFVKFFVLNARMLEYMRLELHNRNRSSEWMDKQQRLLRIKNKVSGNMQLDFESNHDFCVSYISLPDAEGVHDLSTADPFA